MASSSNLAPRVALDADGPPSPSPQALDARVRQAWGTSLGRPDGRKDTPDPLHRTATETHDQPDRHRAEQTLPRGASRDDPGQEPAVDPEVWLLHVRYQRTGCPDALGALVEEYTGYTMALARRMHREGEPLEDLQQVAMEALVTTLQRFDCGRGTPFPGFATPTIIGALKRHYRDHGWALRVPRSVHELAVPAREAADRLTALHGRAATVAEVAAELGVAEHDLLIAQSATRARSTVSLDGARRDDGAPLLEIAVNDERLALAEGHVALVEAMEVLGDRERTVLGLYFFEELTQNQIAQRYGVSQMQVSRWIAGAIKRLRARMSATADDEGPIGPGAQRSRRER
jgi:RNA polymerase sigma-B factor